MTKRSQKQPSEGSQKSSDAAWSDGYRGGAIDGFASAVDLVLYGLPVGLANRRPSAGLVPGVAWAVAQDLVVTAVRRFGWSSLRPELAQRLKPEDLARMTALLALNEDPAP